ncbi:MAG TPA: ExsB family transcriptional regulator [Candidatus Bathyarchaeia archaeon]|nr:ExsB family transcriptional regulator [Candidatus Bathyarchaeia archaeon]
MIFDPEAFIGEKVTWLRKQIGDQVAFAATSGGIDSTACAVLAHKAVGKKVIVGFLDDGLMRDGEPEEVFGRLQGMGLNTKLYRVADEFFKALKGVVDPEKKRKAFRETFYRTLSKIAKDEGAEFLVQGTIAADVLETKGGVKTQHNVLDQIGISSLKEYGFKLLEPLVDLYKPQVRAVGERLNLAKEVYERRPFPGPGLSVRVIGEVTPARVETVRKATKVVEKWTADLKCFQAFAVLMNDRATGLQDGERKFGEIIAVRAVDSKDALTAETTRLPWDIMEKIRDHILKELPSVVKVVYDITGKPPSTIEYI